MTPARIVQTPSDPANFFLPDRLCGEERYKIEENEIALREFLKSSGKGGAALRTMEDMERFFPEFTQCLTHQLPEDQGSPVGPVCSLCKQRLYVNPPRGRVSSCWESQPGAYTLAGEPCFVYTIIWEDFRIRSLHPAGVLIDLRSVNRRVVIDAAGLAEIEQGIVESTDPDFMPPPDLLPPEEEDEFGLFHNDEDE